MVDDKDNKADSKKAAKKEAKKAEKAAKKAEHKAANVGDAPAVTEEGNQHTILRI